MQISKDELKEEFENAYDIYDELTDEQYSEIADKATEYMCSSDTFWNVVNSSMDFAIEEYIKQHNIKNTFVVD